MVGRRDLKWAIYPHAEETEDGKVRVTGCGFVVRNYDMARRTSTYTPYNKMQPVGTYAYQNTAQRMADRLQEAGLKDYGSVKKFTSNFLAQKYLEEKGLKGVVVGCYAAWGGGVT